MKRDRQGRFHMLYPEDRHVSAAWILAWADDLMLDGDIPRGYRDVYEAMAQLEDIGAATFASFDPAYAGAMPCFAVKRTVESISDLPCWIQLTESDF